MHIISLSIENYSFLIVSTDINSLHADRQSVRLYSIPSGLLEQCHWKSSHANKSPGSSHSNIVLIEKFLLSCSLVMYGKSCWYSEYNFSLFLGGLEKI